MPQRRNPALLNCSSTLTNRKKWRRRGRGSGLTDAMYQVRFLSTTGNSNLLDYCSSFSWLADQNIRGELCADCSLSCHSTVTSHPVSESEGGQHRRCLFGGIYGTIRPTVVNVASHIKNNLKLNIVLSTPVPIMRSAELQLPMSLFNNAFKFSPKFVNNSSHIRSSFGVTLFLSIGTTRRYLTAMQ